MDVVVCITGQRPDHASRAFDQVLRIDPDVTHLVSYIPLPDSSGQRKQRTPVAEIQTVLRVITQLPCKNLGPLKREICEVFSRFMAERQTCYRRGAQPRRRHVPPKYSVVDAVVCITGKTPQNAKHTIDEVVNNRDDMCQEITLVKRG